MKYIILVFAALLSVFAGAQDKSAMYWSAVQLCIDDPMEFKSFFTGAYANSQLEFFQDVAALVDERGDGLIRRDALAECTEIALSDVKRDNRVKLLVDAFADTPKSCVGGIADGVCEWFAKRKASDEQRKKVCDVVIKRVVAKADGDVDGRFRIAEARRAFLTHQSIFASKPAAASPVASPAIFVKNPLKDENAIDYVELNRSIKWKLTLGMAIHGGVKMRDGASAKHNEMYGAEVDAQRNIWEGRHHNLWLGIGGGYMPKQDLGGIYHVNANVDGMGTDVFRSSRLKAEYGEFRLLLVPEWKVTKKFGVGLRGGVAFDFISLSGRAKAGMRNVIYPVVNHERNSSISESDLVVQAIIGCQAKYIFSKYVGVYFSFDYRLGGDALVDKRVENDDIRVDLDGWQLGVGVAGEF